MGRASFTSSGGNDLNLVGNITWDFGNPQNTVPALTPVNPKLVFVRGVPPTGNVSRIYLGLTTGNTFTVGYLEGGSTFRVISSGLGPIAGAPGLADMNGGNLAISYVSADPNHVRDLVVRVNDFYGNQIAGGSVPYADLAFDPGMVLYNGTLYISAQNYNSHQNAHFLNLIHAIRSGEALNQPIAQGNVSTTLVQLSNIAYFTQRVLTLDTADGYITGDKEASAMRDRKYEKGWEPKV